MAVISLNDFQFHSYITEGKKSFIFWETLLPWRKGTITHGLVVERQKKDE